MTMKITPAATALLFALPLLFPLTAAGAQSASRYGTWQDESQPQAQDQVQQLVDKLRALVDQAEQARAADPRFLRDLRDLVRAYDWPWRVEILHDDFRDGDYTHDPAWQVRAGLFRIERGGGLYSRIEPAAAAPASRETQQGSGDPGKELATAIIGGLLQSYGSKGKAQESTTGSAPERYERAVIEAPAHITNAFALRVRLASFAAEGRLEIGPYQGRTETGYRLVYNPGSARGLELQRVSARGSAVVDASREPLDLETGGEHVLQWTRDGAGEMVVSVDGRELIRVTDRGYRDPFDGLVIANGGGEFSVREVGVWGVRE